MKKSLRILMLEDVEADAQLIEHELTRSGLSFEARRVETADDFIRELTVRPPDVILSDHGLPAFDGFAALTVARDRFPEIPFIFVATAMGEETAVDSIKSGASDYVLKGRLSTLAPAIHKAIRANRERARRKLVENNLQESEERFRMLVKGVKDYAIFMLEPDGRVSSWNAGAENIMGYPSAEIIGQGFNCFYKQEDRDRGKPALDLMTASVEGRLEEEAQRCRKDGSLFWAHVIITALQDDSGQLKGFAKVVRDVSERKKAQETLRKSEERYRLLVDLCADAIFVLKDRKVVFANNAGRRLLQIPNSTDLLGKSLVEFVPEKNRARLEDYLNESHSNPELRASSPTGDDSRDLAVEFREEKFVRADGSLLTVEIAATPLIFHDELSLQVIAHDVTLRKEAAISLHESDARKAAILDTSLDAILCVDAEGVIQEWNAAASRIFGYRKDEAVGRSLDSLLVAPTSIGGESLSSLAEHLFVGGGSLAGRPLELRGRKITGDEFPVELVVSPPFGRTPSTFSIFIRDISDRKETETALKQSEARFVSVVESALDAILTLDDEGRITDWNPAAEKLFGYSRAYVAGRTLEDVGVSKRTKASDIGLSQLIRSSLRGKATGYRLETTATRANGADFSIELTITKTNFNGADTFTVYARDITDTKRADTVLRKNEERLRAVITTVEEFGLFMLDANARIVVWNKGAERIIGYTPQEIVGRRFTRFFTPEDISRGKPAQALAVATAEGRYRDENWYMRKDGSQYFARISICALRDKADALSGFSAIITEMEGGAEDSARSSLPSSKSSSTPVGSADDPSKQFDALIYSISHDFRAPLRHITGFSEMLQNDAGPQLDPSCLRYLKTITDSAAKMGRMIDDLLDYSRMTRAKFTVVPVAVTEIVRGVIRDIGVPGSGPAVDWDIGELPTVNGDVVLLRRIFSQLLTNAVKFSRLREAPLIQVGCNQGKDEVVFSIRDNGVGFDPKYADKLFGVFQRFHLASQFEGTGMGLAVARRAVERQGGRIWAESAVDKGATFYFSIPLQQSEETSSETK